MRVVTFGDQAPVPRTREAVLGSGHGVVLAVTHPPSSNPYEQMWNDSVEDLARSRGIPVHLAQRPDDDLVAAVRAAEAHVSTGRFGTTPGRATVPVEGGTPVVCGSPIPHSPAPAIVLERLRLENGAEVPASEIFGLGGGYITPTRSDERSRIGQVVSP